MKKILFFLAICLAFCLAVFSPAVSAAENPPDTGTERVIIGFKHEIDLSILEGINYELQHVYDKIHAISVVVPEDSISGLRAKQPVDWVEYDRKVEAAGQITGWGYEATVMPETKQWGFSGAGVKVAVIDTGISKSHPDLNVAGGVSFVEGYNSYHDNNGHGTHVAGVIAAQNNDIGTVGVAPDAEIYAVKALDESGVGTQTGIVAGIEWAISEGIDIINLSISGHYSSIAVEKAVEKADEQGILVLAASGNDDTGMGQVGKDIMYPARYPTVIGVGSVDKNMEQSNFSYFGPSLDFTAPGEAVYSTYVNSNGTEDSYREMSGTSMATPYVAGILALYKQAYPTLGIAALKQVISEKAVDLGIAGKDPLYGSGLVTSPSSLFWDLKASAWYTGPITYLIQEKFVSGYPNHSFRPNGLITRGEAVTMVGRVLELDGTQRQTVYEDVDSAYFASGYIASATEAQFINGYPDNTFAPRANITRGEVAVVIQKAFGFPLSEAATFADVEAKKFYFKAVNGLSEASIVAGYPGQMYKPDQNVTRAEFSIMLSNALKGKMEIPQT